jgi:hypothetical protein
MNKEGQHPLFHGYGNGLFRPRCPVRVYINIIVTFLAQYQGVYACAVMRVEIEMVTIPAERDTAAITQHDRLFLTADTAFSLVRHNGNHGADTRTRVKQ